MHTDFQFTVVITLPQNLATQIKSLVDKLDRHGVKTVYGQRDFLCILGFLGDNTLKMIRDDLVERVQKYVYCWE